MNFDCSIVIPFHSNINILTNCVDSLIKTTPDDTEIIIIANNRNPDEINISFPYPNVHVKKYNCELLYPKAVNIGVGETKSQNVILSDADTCYFGNWFQEMIRCYTKNKASIVGAKLIYTDNNTVRDFGMGYNGYNWPHPFKNLPSEHPLVMKNRIFQTVCTACCIINKEDFQMIGGLDERLGYSYSDMDLCLRFAQQGKKVWGCGHAAVYHKGSSIKRNMSHYKKDIRGKFFELNAQRFHIDMQIYYEESARYYFEKHNVNDEYILIDLSTIYNKSWHFDMLRDILNIAIKDIYSFEQPPRDKRHIELYESIPSYIFNLNIPLIYFVDNHTALSNNCIWQHLRHGHEDLVIDRHGNIVSFAQLSD